MEIAICDDEAVIREQIKEMLHEYGVDCSIEMYATGGDLAAADMEFDIVFLDIQMDGINGIDAAECIREKSTETILIFVTGIKEYVFQAFDVTAFHYLLKPIDKSRFFEVFERAEKKISEKYRNAAKQIFIKNRNENVTLDKNRIMYVESRIRKVAIHTASKCIETYSTMNRIEKLLGKEFYRCHRGYLVNMAYVLTYDTTGIVLANGEKLYMAREKYGDFVKTYMRYLRDGGVVFV